MSKAKNNTSKTLVLLDSHAIIHRAYHALPEFLSSSGEPTGALYGLSSMLMKIISDLKPDYIVACYDLPQKTFRHLAYDAYKAGRAKTDDALIVQLKNSRQIFEAFNIPIYDASGFEADDVIGTIVEKCKKFKIENCELKIIIASGDMDTMQLVDDKKVQVYTLKKGITDTILYDEEKMIERFHFKPSLLPDYKGLRGDASDNIKGIKGIGEKTAENLIANFGTIEDIYKKLKKDEESFKKAGITPRMIGLLKEGEEEALFSKELATIRIDVPVKLDLEGASWKSLADFEKVNGLLMDLGFRSLVERVKKIFDVQDQLFLQGPDDLEAEPPSEVDEKELGEIAIALWLTNSNITNPTLEDILNYANTQDFDVAKNKILNELKEKELESVWKEVELPIIPVIKKIGEKGIKVDKNYLEKLSKEYHKELDKFQQKIWKIAGEEFNINSPKQVGELLFDKMGIVLKNHKKTSTGAKSTNIAVLEQLKEEYPIVSDILRYREFQKLLSTYIDNIPKMLDENNRLHTTFLQAGTTTGRMASQEPNLQNIPTKTELGQKIRSAFVTEKGFKLVAFDYSQIELRLAALLSGDGKLINIFKEGRDVHTAVASEVFGVPFDQVDKEMRRKAKVINFGILYGMGVNSLRKSLGDDVKREEAQIFYNEYFDKFSKLAEYIENIKRETKELGYTKTFFGRRRYFEGIDSRIPFVRAMTERMAINAPIQGTSADMTKIAMGRVNEYIVKKGLAEDVFILLQVHDELILEVREDLVKKIVPEIQKIMEDVILPKDAFGIKFVVDASVGEDWGNLNKFKFSE